MIIIHAVFTHATTTLHDRAVGLLAANATKNQQVKPFPANQTCEESYEASRCR